MKVNREACSSSNPCSQFGSGVSGCMSNLKTGSVGSNNYTLIDSAADDLVAMYEAMPEDVKKNLKISDSYRPLKIQCNIFDWDHFEKTKKRRKKGTSGVPVAPPGSSNHGWGRALDLSAKKAQKWIKDNGYKFGWCWGEVESEPWHFTYCGEGENKSPGCSKFCKGPKETKTSQTTTTTTTIDSSDSTTTTTTTTSSMSSSEAKSKFFNIFGKKSKQTDELNENVARIKEIIKKIL